MTKQPTGQIVSTTDGALIQIPRQLDHSPETVWSYLADSDKLSLWYGSYTGEPASGEVSLSFVESPETAGRVRIDDCTPTSRLAVTLLDAPDGDWTLALALEENDGGTRLVFTHTLTDVTGSGDVGPGWEYYLDRLAAALDGGDADAVQWEEYHPSMVEHYSVDQG